MSSRTRSKQKGRGFAVDLKGKDKNKMQRLPWARRKTNPFDEGDLVRNRAGEVFVALRTGTDGKKQWIRWVDGKPKPPKDVTIIWPFQFQSGFERLPPEMRNKIFMQRRQSMMVENKNFSMLVLLNIWKVHISRTKRHSKIARTESLEETETAIANITAKDRNITKLDNIRALKNIANSIMIQALKKENKDSPLSIRIGKNFVAVPGEEFVFFLKSKLPGLRKWNSLEGSRLAGPFLSFIAFKIEQLI